MIYDVIIIGAGAAGLFASVAASQEGASVLVLEKNKKAGKKLRLTGGGRCNVTSTLSIDEIIENIPGNGKFLYSTFSQFNNQDLLTFFPEHHVPLKEEDHGRVFPTTDKARTIVECLENIAKEQGAEFKFQTEVQSIREENGLWYVKTEQESFCAYTLIIATGGCTYRQTGSTGDGYRFAKGQGHTVTPLYPTEAPLISEEAFIKDCTLQGISLREVALTVWNEQGKKVITHQHDLLFTHFGLSGPAALRCSMFVNQLLRTQKEVTVTVNFHPEKSETDWQKYFQTKRKEAGKKSVKNAWNDQFQERVLLFLCEQSGIDPQQPVQQVTPAQYETFYQKMTALPLSIVRTYPLEKAFVTGGGVSLKEITPKTLESKKKQNLFFAGEVLDINAYTGGFNLTAAFCMGYVAGTQAATLASYYHY